MLSLLFSMFFCSLQGLWMSRFRCMFGNLLENILMVFVIGREGLVIVVLSIFIVSVLFSLFLSDWVQCLKLFIFFSICSVFESSSLFLFVSVKLFWLCWQMVKLILFFSWVMQVLMVEVVRFSFCWVWVNFWWWIIVVNMCSNLKLMFGVMDKLFLYGGGYVFSV